MCLTCGKEFDAPICRRGKYCSPKCANIALKRKNLKEENPSWRGGRKVSTARAHVKRRQLGYTVIYPVGEGEDGHHVTDEFVIGIPREVHQSMSGNRKKHRTLVLQWFCAFWLNSKHFIYILLYILYIMASILIIKNIDLQGIHNEIIRGAEEGVSAAVQDGVSYIKNDMLLGQEYLGHIDFPDVKPATKKQKARRGEMHVLISTGAYKDSFIGESSGLEGKITGGGGLGYASKLHKKWKIDALFNKVHKKTTLKIIRDAIKRRL